MNNTPSFNEIDLQVILEQLISPKQIIQEYSSKQVSNFINRNRESSDEIISKIAEFFDKNINELHEKTFIQVITNILEVLQENNISTTFFISKIIPLLMHIIYYCNRTIDQYNTITRMIGNLINICNKYTSQLIESHVNSIMDIFKKEQSFKYENTKYGMILVLKEFLINSPVISYNKIIEAYNSFEEIIMNYKDQKEYIRIASVSLIKEFLLLLSNRDLQIREEFTKRIYNACVDCNIKSNINDSNVIQGVVLVLQACTERREFFNEKYKTAMTYLNKYKAHKSQNVKITIIDAIPLLGEYQKDVFEENYFDEFITYFTGLYNSKPNAEIKVRLLICFGKLSLFISKNKFLPVMKNIMRSIKNDIDKGSFGFNVTMLDCLTHFMKNFSNETINELAYNDILAKMFICGFYDSHINYLLQLISVFPVNSIEIVKIHLIILDVISMIICDKKFTIINAIEKIKHQHEQTSTEHVDSSVNGVVINNIDDFLTENETILKETRKSITTYISNIKSSTKVDKHQLINELTVKALTFLQHLRNSFFERDILFFYQSYCIKLLETSEPTIKSKIIDLAQAPWIPNINTITPPTTTTTTNANTLCISNKDIEGEFMLTNILDSFLNLILSEQNEKLQIDTLNKIDNERYYALLAENTFFNKMTFVLKYNNNTLRRKTIEIIKKIINYNYTSITLFIKKSLLEIFMLLEISSNVYEREDAIVLMSYYVKYTGEYIVDYVQLIFTNLIKILKSETNLEQDNEMLKVNTNNMLIISTLSIICDLIDNKYTTAIEEYFKEIMSICINILKTNTSNAKQAISLRTILSILENDDNNKWKVYYDYIDLINLLILILIKTQNKQNRLYALKIFGFIGAIDPDKMETLINIHRSEHDNNAEHDEYYISDEFNEENVNDILGKQIMTKRKHLMMKQCVGGNSNSSNGGNCGNNGNVNKKFVFDFQKEIIENDLDTCTYHTVVCLVGVLKKNKNQELSTRVIVALKEILSNLNETDKCVIYLILPSLIESLNELEGNIRNIILERIYYIIKTFPLYCKPFIGHIVNVVVELISEKDFQKKIIEMLKTMLELFSNEMVVHLPRLIPIMLSLLTSSGNKTGTIALRKKIFSCFNLITEHIGNYLGLIIPEMVTILYSSMNEIKYSTIYNSSNNMYLNHNNTGISNQSSSNSNSNMLLSSSMHIHLQNINNVNSSSNSNNNSNVNENAISNAKTKDDEIFTFIENVIKLPSFVQHMPKVITILIKYMDVIPITREKIIQLFLEMLKNFKKEFLSFFPMILRSIKECEGSNLEYLNMFKNELDRNELIELIEKFKVKERGGFRKRTNDSYENALLTGNTKLRTRSGLINREALLNEFNPSNCSIEDDWYEWFKSSSKSLFLQSPSYALFCCQSVSDYYQPLTSELYNYAFMSVWKMLNMDQKSTLINYLNIALESSKTPPEIQLTILNLAEFIEREENHIEFINFEKLGQVADVCKAYAKALYYVENYYRNNHDYKSLEKLITLYHALELPESAIGILKLAKKYHEITNEEDWYLKLHQWKETLDVINTKPKVDNEGKLDLDITTRNITCLDGLSDWESLLTLGKEIETNTNVNVNVNETFTSKMNLALAKASLNLGEWDNLKHYTSKIKPEEDEDIYETNFFSAVLEIKEKNYTKAQEYINKARNAIDEKIKTLLTESYQRAYKLLISNEQLYELEEIITLYTKTSHDDIRTRSELLRKRWDERLEISDKDIKNYERTLAIRGLLFRLDEDYETHLKLAKICRRENMYTTCMIVLNRLSKHLEHCDTNISVNVKLNISKCLTENNNQRDSQQAIMNLKYIIDNEIHNINDKLKSKIYCYYAIWNSKSSLTNEANVNDILTYLDLSTKYNANNYKAWHHYAMLNYKFYENNNINISSNSNSTSSNNIQFASNAIKGFTNSVCIGGTNISKTLQDLLRVIDLWFQVGTNDEVNANIMNAFKLISIECWLLVIPQLLARVGVTNDKIRNSLVYILRQIGLNHPHSISYPLIVLFHSKSKIRAQAAKAVLKEMSLQHKQLLTECELIINELNRCALLLHEQWIEAIEESAKLFFHSKDVNGMIKILLDVHKKMECEPVTMNEIHFHQMYRSELNEAKAFINDYLQNKNENDIKQAWDIYYPSFKNMNENFNTLKCLDLENVSPSLYKFKESEISIPGMYKSGYPVIKIAGFEKQLTVLNSKQHPRKIILYGSNGKEYMYLLKGHEDLRQDERAMQLFGLVNTLLSNEPDTQDKNLFIKRFPVIPLSHNTGIIGWVPNCDTLHQLIKEYRTANKITTNVEHRLMYANYPKFDVATFMTKLEIFKNAMNNTLGLDLYKILWKKSQNSERWLERRINYSRSLAVMSMVGYVLGLGDRHPSNLMLDRKSGKILHIDFGDCFEVAMKRERFPEKVPFRLTRMLIKALEVSGIEGTFRITCENVMKVLRANKDSLIAILTAFVHDPLISFRLLIPLIMKANKRKKFMNKQVDSESLQIKEQEKQMMDNNNNNKVNKEKMDMKKVNNGDNGDDDIELEKKRIGSAEKKLYMEFEEKEDIESDDLNKIAKMVLERIINKLQGTDFNISNILDEKLQVEKLIKQATSHENLSQSYLGWCPFW